MNNPKSNDYLRFMRGVSKLLYLTVTATLLLIALMLIGYALWDVWLSINGNVQVMEKLLTAIGVAVISLALFDVSKYLIEEEVIREKSLVRNLEDTKRSLTKFMTIIAIAVCLEALVFIFEAGKTDVQTLLYPILLLVSGVFVVIGLGIYLRISAGVERHEQSTNLSGEEAMSAK
jgi:phosphate/sulfate permease